MSTTCMKLRLFKCWDDTLQELCTDERLKRAKSMYCKIHAGKQDVDNYAMRTCSVQRERLTSLTIAKGCNKSCFPSMLLTCLGSCMRHSRTNVAASSVSHAASAILPAHIVSRAAYKHCQCYTRIVLAGCKGLLKHCTWLIFILVSAKIGNAHISSGHQSVTW